MLTDPERPLRRSQMGDQLSVVARAQTLTVLGRLEDGARKGSIVEFLYEAGLISRNNRVVNLKEANLYRASLYGANLYRANLERTILQGANLKGAVGLAQDQIEQANGDEDTTLPEGIDRPKSWSTRTDDPLEEG